MFIQNPFYDGTSLLQIAEHDSILHTLTKVTVGDYDQVIATIMLM